MASRFQHFLAIDWSGAKGPRQKGIALGLAHADGGPPVLVDPGRGWSREDVLALLREDLPSDTLVGLDLGIALPFAVPIFRGATCSCPMHLLSGH